MGDSPNLIDYTFLKKRGLFKTEEIEKPIAPISKDGYLDFTNMPLPQEKVASTAILPQSPSPVTESSPSQTTGFTSFWDQVPGQTQAQSPISSSTESYYGSAQDTSSSLSSSSASVSSTALEFNQLKLKLEDMEYKLSRLTEKLDIITSKLIGS